MNIYVANIPFKMTEEELQSEFEKYGEVSSVKIITDHETSRSKGFGFVEMPEVSEGQQAIKELDGAEVTVEGGGTPRKLIVNPARPREEKSKRY